MKLPIVSLFLCVLLTSCAIQKRTYTEATAAAIATALDAYRNDFKTSLPNSKDTVLILTKGKNPKKIIYLSLPSKNIGSTGVFVDPWLTPYRFFYYPDSNVTIVSAGPDMIFGTSDDITWHK